MDQNDTHSTATLLFSFLLSFLGLSVASILGGLVWQRVAARWRGHHGGADTSRGAIAIPSRPKLWDVCIRDALSAAKLSDCAWEQLRPLALRLELTSSAAVEGDSKNGDKSTVDREPRPARWKMRPFRRDARAFQADRNMSEAAEGGLVLDSCRASIAVVIAYPCRPMKAELGGEIALGTVQTRCTGSAPRDGRDAPWIGHR